MLDCARNADRLLGVDLSYRHTRAVQALREVRDELGDVYAVDLVFHNAYGPDKPWFTDRALSGGGCLIDLGTHMVDLALWLSGAKHATVEAASLRRQGRPLAPGEVEDFALAQLELDAGVTARLACSWFLPAGRDCVIDCTLYGTEGAASMRNVGGSFYDFEALRFRGTATDVLAEPPDDWGGRAVVAWAKRLAVDRRFDPAAEEHALQLRPEGFLDLAVVAEAPVADHFVRVLELRLQDGIDERVALVRRRTPAGAVEQHELAGNRQCERAC